jgi:hypothetical protein
MLHPSPTPPDRKRMLPAREGICECRRLSAELLTTFYKLGHFVGSFNFKELLQSSKALVQETTSVIFGSFFQLIISNVPRETLQLRLNMMASHKCRDEAPCRVPPHPDLQARLLEQKRLVQQDPAAPLSISLTHDGEVPLGGPTGHVVGLNDGMIFPESHFETHVSRSVLVNAALERTPLRGTIRLVIYSLV